MTDPITPALTKEEWVGELADSTPLAQRIEWGCNEVATDSQDGLSRHALAALCLHEQPFGFTREDVVNLRQHALAVNASTGWTDHWADNLAARIETLLPPKP